MSRSGYLILIVFLFSFDSHLISAQVFNVGETEVNAYHVEAYRLGLEETIELDGILNEPFWKKITPITDFRQQEPEEGVTPSERTEIYIGFDSQNLYIGAKLYDRNPEGILAFQKRRDQSLSTDDRFMWILDTFNDGRNAYYFETNPSALRGDGLLTVGQGGSLNKEWDGIWDVRTTITNEGWSVEVKIPFRSLDFNPEKSNWGINFQRTIRRKNEEIVWSGWRRNQGLLRPQNAGTLSGLNDISQGVGIEVSPHLTSRGNRSWNQGGSSESSGNIDAGFNASYSITPSIRTSITINTDFAETEVDQRRVNLTRFPLWFPEQRSFFLEGAGIFNFAPLSGVAPFFSRRIGLVDGEPIPITAGLRVLGREGNTNIGLYQIRTGSVDGVNSEDFTAARVSQNILSESNIGVIYTRRATLNNDFYNDRHTLGADMELGTSQFLGDKNLQFQAFFVSHNTHTPEEQSEFWDRTSRGVRLNYPNYPFYGWASYREFGSDFNPAVGFTDRNAFRRFQPTLGYLKILNKSKLLRSWETQFRYEYLMNLDFEPETVKYSLIPFQFVFESGDSFILGISQTFERLYSDFDILRDGTVLIPTGDYRTWSINAGLATASYRKASITSYYTYEGFWTGTRNIYEVSGTLRPYAGINLSVDWNNSDVSLPSADFTTNLLRFRGNIDLTPNIALTHIIQFDDISDVMGLYNRLRWTITPGSDLFLVYSYNWMQIDDRFEPIETQGALKVNYTFRF